MTLNEPASGNDCCLYLYYSVPILPVRSANIISISLGDVAGAPYGHCRVEMRRIVELLISHFLESVLTVLVQFKLLR